VVGERPDLRIGSKDNPRRVFVRMMLSPPQGDPLPVELALTLDAVDASKVRSLPDEIIDSDAEAVVYDHTSQRVWNVIRWDGGLAAAMVLPRSSDEGRWLTRQVP
jgi:hypothetical protein